MVQPVRAEGTPGEGGATFVWHTAGWVGGSLSKKSDLNFENRFLLELEKQTGTGTPKFLYYRTGALAPPVVAHLVHFCKMVPSGTLIRTLTAVYLYQGYLIHKAS